MIDNGQYNELAPEEHGPGNAEPQLGENVLDGPFSAIFRTRHSVGSDANKVPT